MENPKVQVTEISNLLGEDLPINNPVDLGDPDMNQRLNDLLGSIRSESEHAYILRWQGNKVPRGAVVNGEILGWTQHGQALNQEGRMVGTYDRVVEFGGESRKEQVMIVYTV